MRCSLFPCGGEVVSDASAFGRCLVAADVATQSAWRSSALPVSMRVAALAYRIATGLRRFRHDLDGGLALGCKQKVQ